MQLTQSSDFVVWEYISPQPVQVWSSSSISSEESSNVGASSPSSEDESLSLFSF
ncbi:unnamed protein product [Acanthoscelides obtectus]|uniref:Uncharacterized protein n=1 Tax=Acanthoscelides obtectus TaxID=200917 RepID=A0A9P0QI10_ACAOB|nr:unnamed protein product [Acanthoscelides obtectus]CAK1685254.1 hypothetical protein AOBTE_LOCUS35286 [Acanthoscelides obtectus]